MDGNQGIKVWAEEDRPREKLLLKGRSSLSDVELIAILLGSGSRHETAVELAGRILMSTQNDLHLLSKLSIKELIEFKGVGQAKAVSIVASLELGRRRKDSERAARLRITSSKGAFDHLYPLLSDLDHEQFYVILLDRSNHILDTIKISQ